LKIKEYFQDYYSSGALNIQRLSITSIIHQVGYSNY